MAEEKKLDDERAKAAADAVRREEAAKAAEEAAKVVEAAATSPVGVTEEVRADHTQLLRDYCVITTG